VRAAALINGSAAHTVEVDDIFRDGIYHPGAPHHRRRARSRSSRGASGEAFLRAVIVGYEISTRIAAAMGRAHYKYWHQHRHHRLLRRGGRGGELLGLDAKRFAHALATAATFSAGLQQAFRMDSMSKPLHAGPPLKAASPRRSPRAKASPVRSTCWKAMRASPRHGADPDWERATATLARISNRTHDLQEPRLLRPRFRRGRRALALQREMRVSAADIERVRIGTYKAALEVARHESPRTAAEARFSLKYTVASALAHGSVRLAPSSRRGSRTRPRAS